MAKRGEAYLPGAPPGELEVTRRMKEELISQFEAGGDKLREALSGLRGRMLGMALEPHGCRVVQSALDMASAAERLTIADELRGHVWETLASPHGNFVLQKVVEVLSVNSASFVAEELTALAVGAAQHRFGCRVICRIVEHHLCAEAGSGAAHELIDRLLAHLEEEDLICHYYARHVVVQVIEHGTGAHRTILADAIAREPFKIAATRDGSYVVEKALAYCGEGDIDKMVSALTKDSEPFLELAVRRIGYHVAKAVVQSRAVCAERARQHILDAEELLQSTGYGRRLLLLVVL